MFLSLDFFLLLIRSDVNWVLQDVQDVNPGGFLQTPGVFQSRASEDKHTNHSEVFSCRQSLDSLRGSFSGNDAQHERTDAQKVVLWDKTSLHFIWIKVLVSKMVSSSGVYPGNAEWEVDISEAWFAQKGNIFGSTS